jgi:2-polyprenyl-6-methoxyphenol hydroxylase-like FAD-dependent oxidoreductase
LAIADEEVTEMDADVVVVGAGPTGLLLAGDLVEAGVRTVVLERRLDESNVTRAFGVHARTMEELAIRGLADALAKTGTPVRALRLFDSVRIDLGRLPSEYGSLLITPQYETERVLQERLDRLGVPVVRGAEVVGLAQDADGVDVRVRGDGQRTYRAAWLVGADGVRSAVRTAVGLPFPGRSVIASIMLADVRLATPPDDVLAVNAVGDGFAFVAPFGDGWYRIFAWNRRNQVDDTAPLDLDEIRDVTRRALGTDFGMHDPRWMSRFHSDERQVPRYRVGRVSLAGDAAHCHSPAGGQGMNTGMQDAANLGWKLAAVVRGWGDDALLDTYHAERHAIGRQVLRSSGAIIRMAMIRSTVGRVARNVLGRTLLALPPVADRIAGTISGIGFRYPAPKGADASVGTRAPDLALTGGTLFEALHGGRFVLVGAGADRLDLSSQVDAVTPVRSLEKLVLVRPDGYVGWIGTAGDFEPWARRYFLR